MADNSSTDADVAPQPAAFSTIGGGVNLAADQVTIAGDLVGRDKIVGYTAEQVSALLIQVHTTFQPRSFAGRCPYIGLTAFDENNADLFFGREVLVSDLEARVKAARCIVIAGPPQRVFVALMARERYRQAGLTCPPMLHLSHTR